ncbi:unnamed protein product [Triticum turgidum subsp. durum]|uniref:Uncharacterized protein n=1 Tax=Triticum turgidum subsp. durum TaxID=4567 RepID=A0A9R1B685_TRITD|nr:unnamed protein product [Triticum turgidum subsp. durum]
MPQKIRNERRIKKRSIKGATMTPQILKGMRRMTRGNLEGIAVIARNLGSTPMLQTQIVKTGIEDTKRIEIVPAKMVGMRSLKTVNLEKMGRSVRLCFYLQDFDGQLHAPVTIDSAWTWMPVAALTTPVCKRGSRCSSSSFTAMSNLTVLS